MVKTKALDLKLTEILWRRFNFPWCSGYYSKRYLRSLDLLIHKEPNDFRTHRIHPILLFGINTNMQKNHLRILSMGKDEDLYVLAPKKYGSRISKASDVQALITHLF